MRSDKELDMDMDLLITAHREDIDKGVFAEKRLFIKYRPEIRQQAKVSGLSRVVGSDLAYAYGSTIMRDLIRNYDFTKNIRPYTYFVSGLNDAMRKEKLNHCYEQNYTYSGKEGFYTDNCERCNAKIFSSGLCDNCETRRGLMPFIIRVADSFEDLPGKIGKTTDILICTFELGEIAKADLSETMTVYDNVSDKDIESLITSVHFLCSKDVDKIEF